MGGKKSTGTKYRKIKKFMVVYKVVLIGVHGSSLIMKQAHVLRSLKQFYFLKQDLQTYCKIGRNGAQIIKKMCAQGILKYLTVRMDDPLIQNVPGMFGSKIRNMQEKEKAISKNPGASAKFKEAPRVKWEVINKRRPPTTSTAGLQGLEIHKT